MNKNSLEALSNISYTSQIYQLSHKLSTYDSLLSNIKEINSITETLSSINRRSNIFQSLASQTTQNIYYKSNFYSHVFPNKPSSYYSAFPDLEMVHKIPNFESLGLNTATSAFEAFSQSIVSKTALSSINSEFLQTFHQHNYSSSALMNLINDITLDDKIKESFSTNTLSSLSKEYLDAVSIIKQYEKFSALSSFQAILKFDDFPYSQALGKKNEVSFNIVDYDDETILEIDSQVSEELLSASSFEQLSKEQKTELLKLYKSYYHQVITNFIILLLLLKVNFEDKLDLSKRKFVVAEDTKKYINYVTNYRPNIYSLFDNLIGSAVFYMIIKFFGN